MKSRILAILIAVLVLGLLITIAVYSNLAIYISIIAIGLALALQKYVASYFGFFIIVFSNMLHVGDRIRIGSYKGDVRHIGIFYLTLDEVGEDEKLGGELTGKILHIPNLIVLDQPVLNFSKGCVKNSKPMQCDYIFDEIRIPISLDSDIKKAASLLEEIINAEDKVFLHQSKEAFVDSYPTFLREAETNRKVLIHIEPDNIWLKGKFVAPYRLRNELRTLMYLKFIESIEKDSSIKLT
ncbi:MAG: mechanosensitive ion channel [Dehalococcoidia bacterium]|nr:mechanosensitive ion channel [Dehalococcoidia bacterium]MDD5493622.1 mechanosensitive ion channel [Dehalococcoidia bacterium]